MRYIVNFGKSNVDLTPTFSKIVRLDTLADVTWDPVPTIVEIPETGSYFFAFTPDFGDPDIFFQIDSGTGLFREGTISYSADVALDDIQTAVGDILSQQGTPSDLAAVNTEFGRFAAVLDMGGGGGSPNVGASTDAVGANTLFGKLYETRDLITAKTGLIPADFVARLDEAKSNVTRLLGLTKENSVLDQTVFDPRNNLISARMRVFGSKSDTTNLVNPTATYTITAEYISGTSNIQSYRMVRDA
jgi:hypothetical protein